MVTGRCFPSIPVFSSTRPPRFLPAACFLLALPTITHVSSKQKQAMSMFTDALHLLPEEPSPSALLVSRTYIYIL